MKKYFIPMTEDYQKKYYPNGFLDGAHKTTKNSGIVLMVLAAFTFLLFTPLLISGVWWIVQGILAGDSDDVTGGLVFGAIGLVFVAAAIIFLLLGKKFRQRNPEELVKIWAKDNKYPENVIKEYINQVLNSDTYILHIAGEFDAKSNLGVGFLTRDFLALQGVVMKRSDIIAAFLVNTTDTINAGSKIKTVHVLKFACFSRNGRCMLSSAKKEAAEELIAMLSSRNPDLDTRPGAILTEIAFREYAKKIAANS